MRISVLVGVLSLILVGAVNADPATAAIREPTNIAPEPLDLALKTLAKQRQFQVIFRAEVVRDLRTGGAVGEFTPEEALKKLLAGTGLSYKYLDASTVTVFSATSTEHAAPVMRAPLTQKEAGKNSSRDFRMAQAPSAEAQGASVAEGRAAAQGVNSDSSSPALAEVVVTAQKRQERLQDVPVPVTAVNADNLMASNQVRLQDWYDTVPGLNVTPSTQSSQFITIRGLNTGGFQNPLVGIVIDDVPFGASTELGGGYAVPDVDPSDLQRVEVLRGPQGTLYGADSMGGLIKFVTIDPSTERLSGRVEAGTTNVFNGAQWGYNFRASANVPASDTLALRISAFTRQDPGYIDNPVTGINGVNEAHYSGGRIGALWSPSDSVSLKVSSLYQVGTSGGGQFAYVLPGLVDLKVTDLPGFDGYRRSVQSNNATLRIKIGQGELTSVSGYNVNSFNNSEDVSFFAPNPVGPDTGLGLLNSNRTAKFSQEVRYASPIGRTFDVLIGGFYTHEKSSINQYLPAYTDSGAYIVNLGGGLTPTTYEEYAAFGDVTVHVTDRFDIQFGGRESKIKQTQGPDIAYAPTEISSAFNADSTAFTYLVTPQFRINDHAMAYSRLASGYRPGGVNVLPLPGQLGYNPVLPRSYTPDKTNNYEIGLKGDFFQRVLSVDGSIYYISWKDIQLAESVGEDGYTSNGSRAKSQGLELALDLRPIKTLTLSVWGAWNDAELTQALPPASTTQGYAGEQLPYSSKFSGHVSITDAFPITGLLSGVASADLSYVGARPYNFGSNVIFPSYTQTNARLGVQYDTWQFNLFANNIADRRGLVGEDLSPISRYYIQPRTIGLSVIKTF